MVTTKKDAIDLEKQIQALKDNPGKRGPNDLEQRIEDLTNINKYHQKLNGELRAEVMFYKKKAEHYQVMSDQLKKELEQFKQKATGVLTEFRNKGDV